MVKNQEQNRVWGQKIIQKPSELKNVYGAKGVLERIAQEGQDSALTKEGIGKIQKPSGVTQFQLIHPETGFEQCGLNLGITTIPPHGELPLHRHNCYELFYILEGRGKYVIEGKEFWGEKGDAVNIPPNAKHKSINYQDKPWVYLYVMSPPITTLLDDIELNRKYGNITVFEE